MKMRLHATYGRLALLCLGFALLAHSDVHADGKFFVSLDAPRAEEPFQRAIIVWRDGRELLLVQPAYRGAPQDFAWVVPVPDVPDLASIPDPQSVSSAFMNLAMRSGPTVHSIGGYLFFPALFGFVVFSVLLLICALRLVFQAGGAGVHRWLVPVFVGLVVVGITVASLDPDIELFDVDLKVSAFVLAVFGLVASLVSSAAGMAGPVSARTPAKRAAVGIVGMVLCSMVVVSSSTLGSRDAELSAEVHVLYRGEVGIYETQVIRGTDARAVSEWLSSRGFGFGREDEAAFRDYVARGWCFVASRIGAKAQEARTRDGLLQPLLLAFKAPEPIYPFALSATAGSPTEIVLYTLAEAGVEHPLLPLKFRGVAGGAAVDLIRSASWMADGAAARAAALLTGPFVLTKLGGPLSAKESTEDLVLKLNPELSEHQESVWSW